MKEQVVTENCGRENDLIAFLYGELNDSESRAFQRHMHECRACGDELNALREVRQSVVSWRNESLVGAISPQAITARSADGMRWSKPSASAAVREFFNLSPLWLKGTLAFATLLFCLFASLAILRRQSSPGPSVATQVNNNTKSENELNAIVEQRVQEELRRINTTQRTSAPVVVDAGLKLNTDSRANRRARLAGHVTAQKDRRPLSSVERAQLASDLRLVPEGNEVELDLLDEGINK